MAEKIYQASEIIFTKGDPSEFAYWILTGEVEILRDYPESPTRLAVLGAGDILGEMGLIDERPRSLTARTIKKTEVSTLTREEFTDLILNQPREAVKYLSMFFERLRAMNMRAAHGDEFPPPGDSKEVELDVTIFPLTKMAAEVVDMDGLEIENFPFRIGRESRRRIDPLNVNDLLLPDRAPFNVSQNHFSIQKNHGEIFIHDRGSYLGTSVNGRVIGGNHVGAWTALEEGENEIIVGSIHSPFRFRINVFVK